MEILPVTLVDCGKQRIVNLFSDLANTYVCLYDFVYENLFLGISPWAGLSLNPFNSDTDRICIHSTPALSTGTHCICIAAEVFTSVLSALTTGMTNVIFVLTTSVVMHYCDKFQFSSVFVAFNNQGTGRCYARCSCEMIHPYFLTVGS